MESNEMSAVCRLCLGEKVTLLDVFETKGMPGWTAAHAIEELLRIQVSAGDIYPQCVCVECMTKLEDFKLFKQQCESSKELLDRAYAVNHRIAANEARILNSDVQDGAVSCCIEGVKEEAVEMPTDPLDLDETTGNGIKTETEDSFNDLNEMSSAEVMESAHHQVSIMLKSEYEDHVWTEGSDRVEIPPNKPPAVTMKPYEEIPEGDSPCESNLADSNNINKEEVIDITDAESDSDGSFEKDILVTPGEELTTSSSVSGVLPRKGGCSFSSDDMCGAQSSGTQNGNIAPVDHSRLSTGMAHGVGNGENVNKSSSATAKNYSCEFCEEKFSHVREIEAHIGSHGRVERFICGLCKRGFHLKNSFRLHNCDVKTGRRSLLCSWCGKVCIGFSLLSVHERVHTGEMPFECPICLKKLRWERAVRAHRLKHEGERPHKCPICGKAFGESGNLKKHLMSHTGETPFVCDVCGKGFRYKAGIRRHVMTHSGVPQFLCAECGKEFFLEGDLKTHMRTHEEQRRRAPRTYQCPQCGDSFPSKGVLTRHRTLNHREPLECSECGKAYCTKGSLKNHMMTHSSAEMPFKCSVCEKGFYDKGNFKKHLVSHSDTKPFKCRVCGREFHYETSLKKHVRTHSSERRFVCNECGKAFRSRECVKAHMDTHFGVRKFECGECGKRFLRNTSLKTHSRTHSGERPYACTECPMAFNRSHHVKQHMKKHTGERPFRCTVCPRAFSVKRSLEAHALTH